MDKVKLTAPLKKEDVKQLRTGQNILLSGIIYTARDAAHKKLDELIKNGESLPIELEGNVIYYCGPCPAKDGDPIGSAGPTTSGRMDRYTPELLDRGLCAMIGKGRRDRSVIASIKKNGAVYFGAIGGAGALIASRVISSETVAFPELGTEAIRKLTVEDFPLTVLIDANGNDLYDNRSID